MSGIKIEAISVGELLLNLFENRYLVPEFQRDFVWNESQIIGLLNSILEAKPIGMITVWEQEFESDLPLENIKVEDRDNSKLINFNKFFSENPVKENRSALPASYSVILDGKQRSTAIAMAFGGLSPDHGSRKFSGRYFIDVKEEDKSQRLIFLKNTDIRKRKLDNIANYVRQGLFPIKLDDFGSRMHETWMKFSNNIDRKEYYGSEDITDDEIKKREARINESFSGLLYTKLAVYKVPKETTLPEICEIFETLNTTGTTVSTLDLIHSFVYSDTFIANNDTKAIKVRDNIESLSENFGVKTWLDDRPVLAPQILACIQIALDKHEKPRKFGVSDTLKIDSIKSKDLLSLSSKMWETFFENCDLLIKFFSDFQKTVASGNFSLKQCPYPGIINIYIALRWHLEFEQNDQRYWTTDHLNKLFRAFFWRNTFSSRYDQGFMTQIPSDLLLLKNFLNKTKKNQSDEEWNTLANDWLKNIRNMKTEDAIEFEIEETCRNAEYNSGAMAQGAKLLLYTRSNRDFVDPKIFLKNLKNEIHLHHIFPKDWLKNNKINMDENQLSKWINSPANLIPLSPESNLKWKTMEPSQAIEKLRINSSEQLEELTLNFINNTALDILKEGPASLEKFWNFRAKQIYEKIKKNIFV